MKSLDIWGGILTLSGAYTIGIWAMIDGFPLKIGISFLLMFTGTFLWLLEIALQEGRNRE